MLNALVLASAIISAAPDTSAGRALFNDPGVGKNGVACAACHSVFQSEEKEGDGLIRPGASIHGVATRIKHLLPGAQLDVRPGTWGGAMHFEMATTEAEINYSPQFSLEEGLRRNINMLRSTQGLATI